MSRRIHLSCGKGCGHVDGSRSLAHAALLIGNRDNASHKFWRKLELPQHNAVHISKAMQKYVQNAEFSAKPVQCSGGNNFHFSLARMAVEAEGM